VRVMRQMWTNAVALLKDAIKLHPQIVVAAKTYFSQVCVSPQLLRREGVRT